ncbi:uncharacterized protein BJX67DRAFT_377486 [Aspergillus lucknowensis]|uniref:Uncharacterized protein n=1 Tax=Aspergillus lucknowensis TaxID=176173 RepID=A0ABR4M5C1_9EURO
MSVAGLGSPCLGIREILQRQGINEARTCLTRVIETLHERARRAKVYAFHLDPDLLDTEIPTLSTLAPWGEGLTEADHEYYAEMEQNEEKVQRFAMAELYDSASFSYLQEAINFYLNGGVGTEEEEGPTELGPQDGSFLDALRRAGTLSRLWWEAVKWDRHRETGNAHFLRWSVRAAMARGHADWLRKEIQAGSYGRSLSIRPPRPIERWRLLPPPPVGYYYHDCAIYAPMAAHALRTKEPPNEDGVFTDYVVWATTLRELDMLLKDSPEVSFNFGAPDFVFFENAKTGWAAETLGGPPFEHGQLGFFETGFYERYYRTGQQDMFSAGGVNYGKVLAICADDLVQTVTQKSQIDEMESQLDIPLQTLKEDLMKFLHKRRYMTKREADCEGFGELLLQTITARLRSMQITYGQKRPWALVKIREALSHTLGPWFTIELKDAGQDIPLVILWEVGEASPRYHANTSGLDPRGIERVSPLRAQLDMLLAYKITSLLERIRADILCKKPLPRHLLKFAKAYRSYLESEDPGDMPTIRSGQQLQRELLFPGNSERCFSTPASNRHAHQDASCPYCQARTEEDKDRTFRRSNDPAAVSARTKIQSYFRKLDRIPRGLSNNQDIFSPSYSESDVRAIYHTLQELTYPISGMWAFRGYSDWGLGVRIIEMGFNMSQA